MLEGQGQEQLKFHKSFVYTQVLITDLLGSIIGWRKDLRPLRMPRNWSLGCRK
jgi:hypothetical protein